MSERESKTDRIKFNEERLDAYEKFDDDWSIDNVPVRCVGCGRESSYKLMKRRDERGDLLCAACWHEVDLNQLPGWPSENDDE